MRSALCFDVLDELFARIASDAAKQTSIAIRKFSQDSCESSVWFQVQGGDLKISSLSKLVQNEVFTKNKYFSSFF